MKLTKEQIAFFETFGYIKFPALLKEDIHWIIEEFEQVFPMFEESSKHTGTKRTVVVPFIDQREKLSALLDDPRIYGILSSLLGEQFNYMGSDGNYYTGDTDWHPDGNNDVRKHLKIAFYLDQLDGSSGALRVIPGSHKNGPFRDDLMDMLRNPKKSMDAWGLHGSEVPAQVLDTNPGDLLVFNHKTFHSAWDGGKSRRMFTMNVCQRFTDDTLDELKNNLILHGTYRREHYYGAEMLNNASPQRMKHLEQVISVSDGFYELTSHCSALHRTK
jgi:hypothetical protein